MSDSEINFQIFFSEKFFRKKLAKPIYTCIVKRMDQKRCAVCKIDRPVTEYNMSEGALRNTCKKCVEASRRKKWSSTYQEYLNKLLQSSKSNRSKTMEFNVKLEHLIDLWEKQDGKCALSGVAMTHHRDGSGKKEFNASIDRIDQNQGYEPHNIHLVCYRVNILRHSLQIDMFYWWIKTIAEHSCD